MENGNSPATKQDLEQVRSEITLVRVETKQEITQLRSEIAEVRSELKQDVAQLRSEMSHQYNDLVERITDSETKLLKAFYSFAQTNSQRMVELEGNDAGLRHRVGTLEVRLLEVEKRLNIPPAA
jgi:hypothetical protein